MADPIKETREFLEACKVRFAEAQKRFQITTANLQRSQAEFAAAQLEHNNWQGVVASELRRLAALQQAAQANQTMLAITPQTVGATVSNINPGQVGTTTTSTTTAITEQGDINKTELVRELLAQHPDGMTPNEVWAVLKNQVARQYIYSILKRLKDSDEAIYQKRRKKYSLRTMPKQEEQSAKEEHAVQ